MFVPSEGNASSARRAGSTRSTGSGSKWDYVKTFYTDPLKWDFVKSVGFFAVTIYLIRDLASNDLLPME